MSQLKASLSIKVSAILDEPFELTAPNDGNTPAWLETTFFTDDIGMTYVTNDERTALRVQEFGKQRLHLYCSKAMEGTLSWFTTPGTERIGFSTYAARDATLSTMHSRFSNLGTVYYWTYSTHYVVGVPSATPGNITKIGRSSEVIQESLSWSRTRSARVSKWYDSPQVTVLYSTGFYSSSGALVAPPVYDISTGTFTASTEVTGAMVVEYAPEFTVFEVDYDTGESLLSAGQQQDMLAQWNAGGIDMSVIPPVIVFVLSKYHVASVEFDRKIFPEGRSVGSAPTSVPTVASPTPPTVDSGQGGSSSRWNVYAEVAGTRVTATERVYSASDPDVYVDVKKTLSLSVLDSSTQHLMTFVLNND